MLIRLSSPCPWLGDGLMVLPLEERQAIAVDFQNLHRLASQHGILTPLESPNRAALIW